MAMTGYYTSKRNGRRGEQVRLVASDPAFRGEIVSAVSGQTRAVITAVATVMFGLAGVAFALAAHRSPTAFLGSLAAPDIDWETDAEIARDEIGTKNGEGEKSKDRNEDEDHQDS